MEYGLGLLTAVVLFLCVYAGYRLGNKPRAKKQEIDEQEQQRAKELRKAFLQVMNYDVNKAYQRKKVT